MPAHKEASNDLAKQLHADAKEFVPSSVRGLCFHSSLDLSFLLMLGVMFGSRFRLFLRLLQLHGGQLMDLLSQQWRWHLLSHQ